MNGINPGDACVITHDIGTSFRQGEHVVVAQIDPDPQAPEFKYLVQSSADNNWYKLSDQDLMPQEAVPPEPQMTQVMDMGIPEDKGINWKTLGLTLLIVLLVAVAVFAVLYFLVWNDSSTDETVDEPVQTIPQTTPRTTPATTPSTSPSTAPTPSVPTLGTVKVSQSQFEIAQNGMSYSQVVGIFGGSGIVRSETGTPGQPGYTIEYAWDGEAAGTAIYCTFVDDKMTNKTFGTLPN